MIKLNFLLFSMLLGWVVFLAGWYIVDIFRANLLEDEDNESK